MSEVAQYNIYTPVFSRGMSLNLYDYCAILFQSKKLPCFYATNNQRSLECDLTSKNSFLMPPISKYFLIQPNWFPLLELIKKKNSHFRNRSVAGTRRYFLVILLLQLFKTTSNKPFDEKISIAYILHMGKTPR